MREQINIADALNELGRLASERSAKWGKPGWGQRFAAQPGWQYCRAAAHNLVYLNWP